MIAGNMVMTLINTLLRELHNETVIGRREEAIKVYFYGIFSPSVAW